MDPSSYKEQIVIVGAGLVGSLMAIYLARQGFNVGLYERRSDIRKHGAEGGRSINLALSNRGWWPLKEIGLEDRVREMVIPMKGRIMHDTDANLTFQPYGKEDQAINSVSRGELNKLLLNSAEESGVETNFEHQCVDANLEQNHIVFDNEGRTVQKKAEIIIGADGAFSAIRYAMQKTDLFNYEQYFIEHGYKELTMPPSDGRFVLDPDALHIWPRHQFMLIALPNKDKSFTCTLFLPFEGKNSFEQLKDGRTAEKFFAAHFPDALPLISDLSEQYDNNPVSSLVTIRCYPWVYNRTVLIGDAAHALVPFYGQGMNCGFEDCRILNDLIKSSDGVWDKVPGRFQECRKQDTDAISDLALENFIVMRDKVADKDYLLRKEIEAKLHELYPDEWIPLYSMVTFNENIPYSEALRLGRIQNSIMNEVMERPIVKNKPDKLDIGKIIEKYKKLRG